MSGPANLAVIGYGFMGKTHAANILDNPAANLLSICSLEEDRTSVPKGVSFFSDYRKMLKEAPLDGVVIATPTPLHEEMALATVEAGKHLFIEKPLAGTLPSCDRIVKRANESGVQLYVGHVLHFWPSYFAARSQVLGNAVGDLKYIRAVRAGSFPAWASWFSKDEESGAVILDLNIHDIDYAMWLVNSPVEEVYCEAREIDAHGSQVWGIAFTTLTFQNGVTAYCEASWAGRERFPFTTRLEIAGTDGLLTISSPPIGALASYSDKDVLNSDPMVEDGYALELSHFIELIQGKVTEPAVTGSYSRDVVRTCLAARESARRHQPVKPEEVEVK